MRRGVRSLEKSLRHPHIEDMQLRRYSMAYYRDHKETNDVGFLNSLFNLAMVGGLLGFAILTFIIE